MRPLRSLASTTSLATLCERTEDSDQRPVEAFRLEAQGAGHDPADRAAERRRQRTAVAVPEWERLAVEPDDGSGQPLDVGLDEGLGQQPDPRLGDADRSAAVSHCSGSLGRSARPS